MITRLTGMFSLLAALAAFGMVQPALADHCAEGHPVVDVDGIDIPVTCEENVAPVTVAGSPGCSSTEVMLICGLTNPQEVALTNLKRNSMTEGSETCTAPGCDGAESYVVEVNMTGSSVADFTDLSMDGGSIESQQGGGPGVDCVIVEGGGTNVYSRLNWVGDQGLVAPTGNISNIRFCYDPGPCKELETSINGTDVMDGICDLWNAEGPTAVAVQGQKKPADPDQVINFCGCNIEANNGEVANPTRFCELGFEAGTDGACDQGPGVDERVTNIKNQSVVQQGVESLCLASSGRTWSFCR